MDKNKLREEILSHIHMPKIPQRKVNAREIGIIPGTGENLRRKLQNAIDDLSAAGGGTLVLPEGEYHTGSLHLRSGVELCLCDWNTRLVFVFEDLKENYPLCRAQWESSPCVNYSALIYACGQTDIALTGEGTLCGGASREQWWNWHHQVEEAWSENREDLQQKAREALRRMNQDGVPADERVFGDGHFLRPNFIQLIGCERVYLKGFTVTSFIEKHRKLLRTPLTVRVETATPAFHRFGLPSFLDK